MLNLSECITIIIVLLQTLSIEALPLNLPKKTFIVETNDESFVTYIDGIIDGLLSSTSNDDGTYVFQTFSETDIPVPFTSNSLIEIQESVRTLDVSDSQNCSSRGIRSLALYSALNSSAYDSIVVVISGRPTTVDDYGTFIPEILDLIQKKQLRVIFLVSDECSDENHDGLQLIEEITEVSSGVIFSLEAQNISQVIRFIQSFDYGDDVNLLSPTLSTPGVSTYQLYVDDSVERLVVVLSGLEPIISITDVDGRKLEQETDYEYVVFSRKLQIILLENVLHGEYALSVFGSSDSLVQVIGFASSPIDIRYKFYFEKTINMTKATERPYTVQGSRNFMLMQVENVEANEWNDHKVIHEVEFVTLLGEVIPQYSFTLTSSNFVKKENADHAHYVLLVHPPEDHFYIRIRGTNNNQLFQRSSKVAYSQWRPVPGKPSSFIVFEIEECNYEAIWYEPTHTFTKSLIGYRFSFGSDTDTAVDFQLPPNVTTYKVKELAKGLTYVFTVAAINEAGVGEAISVKVVTPSGKPLSPPTNIHLIQATDSLLEIAWQPPAANRRGGKIIRYTTIHFLMSEPWKRYRFNASKSHVIFKKLNPDSEYGFQIAAHTIMGQGPYSQVSFFKTHVSDNPVSASPISTITDHPIIDVDSALQGPSELKSVDQEQNKHKDINKTVVTNDIEPTRLKTTNPPDEVFTTLGDVHPTSEEETAIEGKESDQLGSQPDSRLVIEVHTDMSPPAEDLTIEISSLTTERSNNFDEDFAGDVNGNQLSEDNVIRGDAGEFQDPSFNNSLSRIIAYPVNDQAEITSPNNGDTGGAFIILEKELEDVTQPVKGRVVFLCRIKGSPTVNYSWYLDGDLIEERSGRVREKMIPHRGMRLTIRDLTMVDQGIYTCRGENEVGKIETSAVLNVRFGPTGIVTDLQVLEVSSEEVTIKWFPPLLDPSDGPLLNYVVYIYKLSLPAETYKFDTNVTELVYKNLEPNTEYVFRVRAVTSKGIGPYSSLFVKTASKDVYTDMKEDGDETPVDVFGGAEQTAIDEDKITEIPESKGDKESDEEKSEKTDSPIIMVVTEETKMDEDTIDKHESGTMVESDKVGEDESDRVTARTEDTVETDNGDGYIVPTSDGIVKPEPEPVKEILTAPPQPEENEENIDDEVDPEPHVDSKEILDEKLAGEKSDSNGKEEDSSEEVSQELTGVNGNIEILDEKLVGEKSDDNGQEEDNSEEVSQELTGVNGNIEHSVKETSQESIEVETTITNKERPELEVRQPFNFTEETEENQYEVYSTTVVPNYNGQIDDNEADVGELTGGVTESMGLVKDTSTPEVDLDKQTGDNGAIPVVSNGDTVIIEDVQEENMTDDEDNDRNENDGIEPLITEEPETESVDEPAHMTVAAPLQHRVIDYNGKATLRCFVTGNPTPTYEWYHEGKRIPAVRGRIKDRLFGWGSRIIIKNVTEADKGRYTCVARNGAGERMLEGSLTVRGVDKVDDIEVIIMSPTEALVDWKTPNYISSGASYIIRFYTGDNRGLKYHFSTTRTEAYYRNLIPDTAYTFRVKMQRGDRTGLFSNPITVRTLPLAHEDTVETTTASPEVFESLTSSSPIAVLTSVDGVEDTEEDNMDETITMKTPDPAGILPTSAPNQRAKTHVSEPMENTASPVTAKVSDSEPIAITSAPEPMAKTSASEPMAETAAPEPMVKTAAPEIVEGTAAPEPVVGTVYAELMVETAAPEPMEGTVAPEPVVGTAAVEPIVETATPEPMEGTAAPEPVVGTADVEPMVETAAPEPMEGTATPEPMEGTAAPETVEGAAAADSMLETAAPEPMEETSAPEPVVVTAAPKPDEDTAAPEHMVNTAAPEPAVQTAAPDMEPSIVPEIHSDSTTSSLLVTEPQEERLATKLPVEGTMKKEPKPTRGPDDETYLRLIRPLPSITATIGERVIMRCLVEANPPATFLWHKDGDPLAKSSNIKQRKFLKGSMLTFRSITMADAGLYTCIALNSNVIETSGNITVIQKGGTQNTTQKPDAGSSHTVMKRSVRPGRNKDADPSTAYASYTTLLPSLMEEAFVTPDAEKPTVTRVSQHDPQVAQPDDMKVVIRVTGVEPENVDRDRVEEARTDNIGSLNARPSQTWDSSRSDEPYVEIKKYMEEQSVEVGDRVVFLCRIIGNPKPRFLWYKDGAPLVFDDSRMKERVLDIGSRFTIKRALLRDAGIYTCYGLNDYQTVSMRATLEVFNKYVHPQTATMPPRTKPSKPRTKPPVQTTPLISYQTDPVTVQETKFYTTKKHDCIGEISQLCVANEMVGKTVDIDDRISLRCQIYGDPQPEYKWYQNGIRVYPTKLGPIREKVFPWGSRLAFRGARETDSGEYRCLAISAAGIKETKAWLLVGPNATRPPRIQTEPPITTVNAYRPTTQPKPRPPKKTPRPTAPIPPKKTTPQIEPTDVFLPSSTTTPISVQKCISGSNGELCYANMQNQVGEIGGAVVFQCRITGTPEPEFTWFKNGVLIIMEEGLDDEEAELQRIRIKNMAWGSRLVIKDIVQEDAGTYFCVGSNVVSQIVQADLKVVKASTTKPPKKKPPKNKPPKTPTPRTQKPRVTRPDEVWTAAPRPEYQTNNGQQPEGSPNNGRCVVYTGSTCRRYLNSQMVYIDSGLDIYSIDSQLQTTLQTLTAVDWQCMSYLEPFLCFKAFPLCDNFGGSKSLCQEDCAVLTRSYCRDLTDLKNVYPGQYLWMPSYNDCRSLPSAKLDSQCISVGLTDSNNKSPTTGTKPAGKCKPYNSDGICSEYVGTRNTFIKTGFTLESIETTVMSIFTAALTLGSVSQECSNYLLPYICLRALPPCNRNNRPLEVCREDCEVLSNDICHDEFKATLAADAVDNTLFKLNDCLSLPSESGKYSCKTLSISSEFRATETDIVFPTSPQPTRNCEPYKGTVCSKYLSGRSIYLEQGQSQSELENEVREVLDLLTQQTDMDTTCKGYLVKELCLTVLPVCNSRGKKREICREECSKLHNDYCYKEYRTLQVLLRDQYDILTECSDLPLTTDTRGPTCIELGVTSIPEVAPEVEVDLEMDPNERQASTVTLRCRVTGSPRPTIEWSKDGEPLQSTNTIELEKNKVRIRVISEREEGTYTCTAQNSAGSDKQNMLIQLV